MDKITIIVDSKDKEHLTKNLSEILKISRLKEIKIEEAGKLVQLAPLGWKCPSCGAGNAPTNIRCSCVPYYNYYPPFKPYWGPYPYTYSVW